MSYEPEDELTLEDLAVDGDSDETVEEIVDYPTRRLSLYNPSRIAPYLERVLEKGCSTMCQPIPPEETDEYLTEMFGTISRYAEAQDIDLTPDKHEYQSAHPEYRSKIKGTALLDEGELRVTVQRKTASDRPGMSPRPDRVRADVAIDSDDPEYAELYRDIGLAFDDIASTFSNLRTY